jgi:hypothetical protein
MQKTGTLAGTFLQDVSKYREDLARPTGIEPVLRVPETLVISFSLRAREKFFYHRGATQSTRVSLATALAISTISR